MCLYAAKTGLTGVVVPTQTKIVHPPDRWLGLLFIDGDVNADKSEIDECAIKLNGREGAVGKRWAGWDRNFLRCDLDFVAGGIKLVAREHEFARSDSRIATKLSTVHVEVETASSVCVAIGYLTRVALLSSVRSSLRIGTVDVEKRDELK